MRARASAFESATSGSSASWMHGLPPALLELAVQRGERLGEHLARVHGLALDAVVGVLHLGVGVQLVEQAAHVVQAARHHVQVPGAQGLVLLGRQQLRVALTLPASGVRMSCER